MTAQFAKAIVAAITFFTCGAFPLSPPSPWHLSVSAPASSSSSSAHRHGVSSSRRRHPSSTKLQQQPIAGTENETSLFQSANISARIDPLLASFVMRSVRSNTAKNIDSTLPTAASMHAHFTYSDATKAMYGLSIWETSLRKGRLPTVDDFPKDQSCWPEEPLFTQVFAILSKMGLPRLVSRHPEIMASVLLGVAKIVVEFIIAQRRGKVVIAEDTMDQEEEEYDLNEYYDSEDLEDTKAEFEFEFEPLSTEELESLAVSVANNFRQEWGGVLQGVAQLDKVFGYDHGLLDLQVIQSLSFLISFFNHI